MFDGLLQKVPSSPATSSRSAWFALFAHARHEKKVALALRNRDIETFLPTYREKRLWRNRQKVTLEIPLFPSYLFARFIPRQRTSVLEVPGVLNIVGHDQSASIAERYIEKLKTGVDLQRIRPYQGCAIGDRVRIVEGPMAGLEGVLAHERSEFRVVVSVAAVNQSISIEVSRNEIEVLGGAMRLSSSGSIAEQWQ